MSYSGTVTCRYCGGSGHNRRTCPDYKASLVRRVAAGDKWAQATLNRRNRTSVRQCGWCNETGHNKRTCPAKVAAYELLPQLKTAFTKLVEKSTEGVGRGSIFKSHYSTNLIALQVRRHTCFAGGRISEDTVEENRNNTGWLVKVLSNLVGAIDYKCVAPDGRTHFHRSPARTLSLRGVDVLIGAASTTAVISNPSPIEYDVIVDMSTGITGVNMKGWIKVIDLLLNEVVFEEGQ
jgi:hypothetical protein